LKRKRGEESFFIFVHEWDAGLDDQPELKGLDLAVVGGEVVSLGGEAMESLYTSPTGRDRLVPRMDWPLRFRHPSPRRASLVPSPSPSVVAPQEALVALAQASLAALDSSHAAQSSAAHALPRLRLYATLAALAFDPTAAAAWDGPRTGSFRLGHGTAPPTRPTAAFFAASLSAASAAVATDGPAADEAAADRAELGPTQAARDRLGQAAALWAEHVEAERKLRAALQEEADRQRQRLLARRAAEKSRYMSDLQAGGASPRELQRQAVAAKKNFFKIFVSRSLSLIHQTCLSRLITARFTFPLFIYKPLTHSLSLSYGWRTQRRRSRVLSEHSAFKPVFFFWSVG
jgi:hypothetical protein